MCGIIGYVGNKSAAPVLLKGLKRLEYRGYDSAGIALVQSNTISTYKKKGKVAELENFVHDKNLTGSVGISHTRWATHGEPNDVNAHPHCDEDSNFAVVHNGIIENYAILKKDLIEKGHVFKSQTDTEVLVHLVEEFYKESNSFEAAVRQTLKSVEGTYGILVVSKAHPDTIIASRKGSPLVVGIGKGEYYLASDAVPLVEYTKSVVYLNDYDMAILTPESMVLKTLENEIKDAEIKTVEFNAEELEKSGYDHFMLKEIFEQPKALENSMRGRVKPELNSVVLGGLLDVQDKLLAARRIVIVACGTSWHSGLIGKYIIEELTGIPVEVEYASEYRYRKPIIGEKDVILAISQSGETADTLEAIRLAKSKGALTLGICNVVGSSVARETDAGVYSHAGPEIGVASTKAFTTQVLILTMIALWLGSKTKFADEKTLQTIIHDLAIIPAQIETIFAKGDEVKTIAELVKGYEDALFMGRGVQFPIALEAALKLKEISYIHAEGYAAGEMKHGPIALIDENMPCVFVCTEDRWREKVISNMQEVKARRGKIISIINEGDEEARRLSDAVIEVPRTHDLLLPLLSIIPLQLLSYYVAILRGCDVDKPRNLAKSVTVE